MSDTQAGESASKPVITDEIRTFLSQIAKIKSAERAEAAQKNGQLGGRPQKTLSEIPCTCGRSDDELHPTTCPRGRAQRRRGVVAK